MKPTRIGGMTDCIRVEIESDIGVGKGNVYLRALRGLLVDYRASSCCSSSLIRSFNISFSLRSSA